MTTIPNRNKSGLLFPPGEISSVSDTFQIPYGGEITVVAFGMQKGDYCHFEVVNIPGVEPATCDCAPPPNLDRALSVQERVLLQYKGKPVVLTPENPIVVLSAPQGFHLRCIRHLVTDADRYSFSVHYSTSKTAIVGRSMDGQIDMEVDMNYDEDIRDRE